MIAEILCHIWISIQIFRNGNPMGAVLKFSLREFLKQQRTHFCPGQRALRLKLQSVFRFIARCQTGMIQRNGIDIRRIRKGIVLGFQLQSQRLHQPPGGRAPGHRFVQRNRFSRSNDSLLFSIGQISLGPVRPGRGLFAAAGSLQHQGQTFSLGQRIIRAKGPVRIPGHNALIGHCCHRRVVPIGPLYIFKSICRRSRQRHCQQHGQCHCT